MRVVALTALAVVCAVSSAPAQQRAGSEPLRGAAGWTTVPIPANRESRTWCPQLVGVCTDSASGLRWHAARDGLIPMDAVPVGEETISGVRRRLHACRAYAISEVTPDPNYPGSIIGVIGVGDRGCRLAATGGPVFVAAEYDVLVPTPARPLRWLPATGTALPATAARPAGHELDFGICKPLGAGVPDVVGSVLDTSDEGCVVAVDSEARAFKSYRVLARANP